MQHSCSQIEAALHNKKDILNSLTKENCNLIQKKENIHLSIQDITKTISLMKKEKVGNDRMIVIIYFWVLIIDKGLFCF